MQKQQQPNYLALLLVGVVIFFLVRGMGGGGSDDGRDDLSIVERQAKICATEYVGGIADDHEDVANLILSGRITNSAQLREDIRKRTEETRVSAFKDIGVLDSRNVPDKFEDDPEPVARYMKSKSEGYRAAVQ